MGLKFSWRAQLIRTIGLTDRTYVQRLGIQPHAFPGECLLGPASGCPQVRLLQRLGE